MLKQKLIIILSPSLEILFVPRWYSTIFFYWPIWYTFQIMHTSYNYVKIFVLDYIDSGFLTRSQLFFGKKQIDSYWNIMKNDKNGREKVVSSLAAGARYWLLCGTSSPPIEIWWFILICSDQKTSLALVCSFAVSTTFRRRNKVIKEFLSVRLGLEWI